VDRAETESICDGGDYNSPTDRPIRLVPVDLDKPVGKRTAIDLANPNEPLRKVQP
jgi:hypothetical protein